jgi:DNA repair protein RadC
MRSQILQRPTLSSWNEVLDYLRAAQSYEHREQFRVLNVVGRIPVVRSNNSMT